MASNHGQVSRLGINVQFGKSLPGFPGWGSNFMLGRIGNAAGFGLAGAGASALDGIAHHRTGGHDDCCVDTGSAGFHATHAGPAQILGARRALRQRVNWRHAHRLCSTTGADGGHALGLGQRFHAAAFWLESRAGRAAERQPGNLVHAQAFAARRCCTR